MAKTTFVEISEGNIDAFNRAFKSGDRFTFARFGRKTQFLSRKRKKALTQRSLLPLCAELWAQFSQSVKDAWISVGAVIETSGYKAFVQDQTLRINDELEGVATPSLLHQGKVGRINIQAPASRIKLTQLHPENYWVLRAVKGKKGQFAPVKVQEQFALPLTLKLSYKTNLTNTSPNYYVAFYAIVYSLYQGRTIENICEIPLKLQTDWLSASQTIIRGVGEAIGYALFLECENVQGDLFFDNVEAVHSGQNWVRDSRCFNIKQAFTKAFYQIPAHWVALDLPDGAFYNSVYPQ